MKKRDQKKARSLITLGMIITRKGGRMRDKREKRSANKRHQERKDAE